MKVNIETVLLQALGQQGDKYVFGAEASVKDNNPEQFDCSELVQWSCDRVKVVPKMPDGAINQYQHCLKYGTTIPVSQAIKTRGALMFTYPVHHVVFSLGDGRTMEAKGKKYGVGIFSAKNRFRKAGLIPGVDYGKHPLLEPLPDGLTVDEIRMTGNKGGWRLHADGGVFTWGLAMFYGSYPGLPKEQRQGKRSFVQIVRRKDGGYDLISNLKEVYTFPKR